MYMLYHTIINPYALQLWDTCYACPYPSPLVGSPAEVVVQIFLPIHSSRLSRSGDDQSG